MLGVFDSGYGGLTVLRAIHERLPDVSTLYLGDSARAPYGRLDQKTIFRYTEEGVRWLLGQGCPLVVIACNTASAQALRRLQQTVQPREFLGERVLGVVRPYAEAAIAVSKNFHFGVLGTRATVESRAYTRELKNLRAAAAVAEVAAPNLAGLLEQGGENLAAMEAEIKVSLQKMSQFDPEIDTILLACTHFPLVRHLFEKYRPPQARFLPQGEVVADKLGEYLLRHEDLAARLDRNGGRRYATTAEPERISLLATRFYGAEVVFESALIAKK